MIDGEKNYNFKVNATKQMDSHDAVTKYQSSVLLISNGKYPGGASDLAPLECADPDRVGIRKLLSSSSINDEPLIL